MHATADPRVIRNVPRTPAGVRGMPALTASNRLPAGCRRRTIGSTNGRPAAGEQARLWPNGRWSTRALADGKD